MQACYQSNPLGAESYREKVGGMRWDGKGATDEYLITIDIDYLVTDDDY